MTVYTCKACNAPATLNNGVVTPTCQCKAPIIAHLTATATGEGGVKQ